jgi:hypothetical protein
LVWYWLLLVSFALGALLSQRLGWLDFRRGHGRRARLAAASVIFAGSWMGFDGARALLLGDYLTPGGAGQLGPWSGVVQALGVEPRSSFMKVTFVIYGASALTSALAFLARVSWGLRAMVVISVLGLWYLPFGTALFLVAISLLAQPGVREPWHHAKS